MAVRQHNLALVLDHIARGRGASRAELARLTGLTKGTVSVLVQELLHAGLVVELGPQSDGAVGRPRTALAVNGERLCGIGLEIGVDHLSVCMVDLLKRVRFQGTEIADNRGVPAARVLGRAGRLTRTALAAAADEGLAPAGLGVAIPGMLQNPGGRLLVAPNLGWRDLPIVDELRRGAVPPELPVLVDNEANLAALAELWLGCGADAGDYIYVTGDVGIGAGLVLGGTLFRGSRGFAGELGHVVVDPDGPSCACGGRGCLERVVGQEALLAAAGLGTTRATSRGHTESPLPELLGRLEAGDARASAAVADAGAGLGLALAGSINLIDADAVILGGIYAPLAPWLAAPVQAVIDRQVMAASSRRVAVRASVLGPDAAVLGAAASVVQHVLATAQVPAG